MYVCLVVSNSGGVIVAMSCVPKSRGVPSGPKTVASTDSLLHPSTSLGSRVGSQIEEFIAFSTLIGLTSGFTDERNPIVFFCEPKREPSGIRGCNSVCNLCVNPNVNPVESEAATCGR